MLPPSLGARDTLSQASGGPGSMIISCIREAATEAMGRGDEAGGVTLTRAATFLSSIARSGISGVTQAELASADGTALPDRALVCDRIRAEVDHISQLLGEMPNQDQVDLLANAGKEALDLLNEAGAEARLTDLHLAGLEAVIRSDGTRPVAFVRGGFVDASQPSLQGSEWLSALGSAESSIRHLCAATGRIDDPAQKSLGYQGTAFLVGDGLVMTSRLVLRAITREGDADHGTLKSNIIVDFSREVGPPTTDLRFPVREILFRGHGGNDSWQQSSGLNFDGLDIAVLALDTRIGTPPPPLPLRRCNAALHSVGGQKVCLVGFPGTTRGLAADIFDLVFAGVKAFKRVAPGLILEPAGEGAIEKDPRNWIMSHDASTLGGHGGSPIMDLESGNSALLGIQLAGMSDRRNRAHAFERIGDSLNGIEGLNFAAGRA